jgi:hypothetical protein
MKGGVSWRLRLKAGGGSGGKSAAESALASFAAAHGAENQTVDEKGGGIFEAALLARNTGERAASEDLFAEELFDWAVARNYKILSMSRQRLTLEDIFVQLTHDDRVAHKDKR